MEQNRMQGKKDYLKDNVVVFVFHIMGITR